MEVTDKVRKVLAENNIIIEDIDARYKLINDLVNMVYDNRLETIKECFETKRRA